MKISMNTRRVVVSLELETVLTLKQVKKVFEDYLVLPSDDPSALTKLLQIQANLIKTPKAPKAKAAK